MKNTYFDHLTFSYDPDNKVLYIKNADDRVLHFIQGNYEDATAAAHAWVEAYPLDL